MECYDDSIRTAPKKDNYTEARNLIEKNRKKEKRKKRRKLK